MPIEETYDKFDSKWEITTSLFTLSNTDPRIGVVSSMFAYVIGQNFELGWLIMYRNGKNWAWLEDNRAIVVADNLRLEHNQGLREREVLDNGNVFEQIDISFSPEQTLAFVNSNEIPAVRVDGTVFEFPKNYIDEVKEALKVAETKRTS